MSSRNAVITSCEMIHLLITIIKTIIKIDQSFNSLVFPMHQKAYF